MPSSRRRFQVAPALAAAALAAVAGLVSATGCNDSTPAGPAKSALRPQDAAKLVALSNKGIALLERYDYVAASEPLKEAMALAPDWIPGRIHYALALIHSGPATRGEARQILAGVLKDEPSNPRAAFLAAWLAENAGETEAAAEMYRTAYRLTGEDPICGAKLGTLLASDENRLKEALDLLLSVHAKRPALVSPVNQIMLIHRQLGNDEQAEVFLAKLLQLKGKLRPDMDQAKIGEELRDAYGNMGPFSMGYRDFGDPGTGVKAPAGPVTAAPQPVTSWKPGALTGPVPFLGAAVLDFDSDGDLDLFVCGGAGASALLRNDGGGKFTDVAKAAGVEFTGVYAVAAGATDADPTKSPDSPPGRRARVDLLVVRADGVALLRNQGNGTFTDGTKASGLGADAGGARSALFVDLDQDGDLDMFLAGAEGHTNRLWSNKGPGVFEDVTKDSGLAGDGGAYGPAVVIDFDEDYDLDLVVTRPSKPPAIFANDRLMKFHTVDAPAGAGPATAGGISGDFDRDGHEDVLLATGAGGTLLRGTGRGFTAMAVGMTEGVAADIDLRGAGVRDIVCGDGWVLHAPTGAGPAPDQPFEPGGFLHRLTGNPNLVVFDSDGDGVEELFSVRPGEAPERLVLTRTSPANSVSIDLEGVVRNEVQAGWSNIEGRGSLVEIKAGALWQQKRTGNPSGFGCAATTRIVAGVGGASEADFVRILWPDGVQHAALSVPSGPLQVLVEEQRRPDSCPLLFSWDGRRWAFVTDFLGVGGVGFLIAPGVYGPPDPTESVKVDSSLVKPRAGNRLVFKLHEAMEEVCYIDHCDLVAVDHPAGITVYPDERFQGEPPFPNGDLLAYDREILPVAAKDETGADVLDRVLRIDRRYPDAFTLHPRLLGAVSESVLELDFGDRLADVAPGAGVVFYGHGWIEYGYTRTSVAAAGEGFTYQVPTLEAWDAKAGSWRTLVANLGYPAGFPRVMTYDLTGLVSRETPRLRIRTNFEVYWDRVWLAPKADAAKATRQTVVAAESADLRWVGYPREYSPDGGVPRIYDYGTMDPVMPWKTVAGDYTKFGEVSPLLTKADDMYVIFGKGEEIEVRFDGNRLPALPEGWTRSYVLRFTGWCKGQELYTAHGFTVEPLPFLGMSHYPYRADERYPDDEAHREYRRVWNTRRVNAPTMR